MSYIVVVEDDDDIQASLRTMLEDEGHKVDTASNGELALELLEERERPCLMLVDLFMPVMDGFELIRRLRTDPRYAELPVVVLTASSATGLWPGTPVIKKPARYATLIGEVQKFCDC